MERNIIIGVSAVSVVALVLAITLPGGRQVDQNPKLPWLITPDEAGSSTVFGITLGKSSLADARQSILQQGVTNLFRATDGKLAVETYFQNLYLSGIKADMVLTLDLTQAQLEQMYLRGLRISQLESGAKKIDLSEQDAASVATAQVGHITYIPAADLEADLIRNRFGEPEKRVAESEGIEHWLYPSLGMDIAVNSNGREVIQYVAPSRFELLSAPLIRE